MTKILAASRLILFVCKELRGKLSWTLESFSRHCSSRGIYSTKSTYNGFMNGSVVKASESRLRRQVLLAVTNYALMISMRLIEAKGYLRNGDNATTEHLVRFVNRALALEYSCFLLSVI